MYTYEKKVLFSDIDAKGKMSFDSLLSAMQDCVNINSESIGKGISYMLEKKRTWFAVAWNIEIKRYPKMFEDITVKTWPYDFGSALGYRNIVITDKNGEDIVCADSIWSMMDMEQMCPTKIEEEDVEGYDLEPRYPMEKLGRKIKLPKELEIIDTVAVRKMDIDYNGHMSNAKYIVLAEEYLDESEKVNRIQVEYKNQAKYGENLVIKRAIEQGRIVIVIEGEEDGSVKAVVDCRTEG
ncbi:MAG: acyl-[acyl-carrier-protein] thioesterase [Wujia sp.]